MGEAPLRLRVHRGVEGRPLIVGPQADSSNDGYRKDQHKTDQHGIFDKSSSTLIIVEVTYKGPEFFHLKNSCLLRAFTLHLLLACILGLAKFHRPDPSACQI